MKLCRYCNISRGTKQCPLCKQLNCEDCRTKFNACVDCFANKKRICVSCDTKEKVASGIGPYCPNKNCHRSDGGSGPASHPGDNDWNIGGFSRYMVCPVCLKDMEMTKPAGAPNFMWVHCATPDEYACPVTEAIERLGSVYRKGVTTERTARSAALLRQGFPAFLWPQDMFLPVEAWHNDNEWTFMDCGHPKSAMVHSFAPGWTETYCSWCADIDSTPRQRFWFYEQRVRHGIALGGKKGEWTVRLAALTFHYKNLGEGIEDLKRMVRK